MLKLIGFILLIDIVYLILVVRGSYGSLKSFIQEVKNG